MNALSSKKISELISKGEYTKFDLKGELLCSTKDEKATLIRHIIAIANPPGEKGILLFGIDDFGHPTGKLDPNISEEQLQQIIREYCEPYIEASYEITQYKGNLIGQLTIYREPHKLPYRARKAVAEIKKDDIYYRYGRHSVIAQYSEIQALIHEGEQARQKPVRDITSIKHGSNILDTKADITRLKTLPIGGSYLQLPCFFPSISSVKTYLQPKEHLDVLINLRHPLFLISAYDIHHCLDKKTRPDKLIEERQKIKDKLKEAFNNGQAIILDSGNYESYWRSDRAWTKKNYWTYLKECYYNFAFCFDKRGQQIGNKRPQIIINEVERSALDEDPKNIGTVLPIVHAKTKDIPQVTYEVVMRRYPVMIALAERELGDGIVERAKTLLAVRKLLNSTGQYFPIHLLGTGNPLSILIYTMFGADSFDGLEWCRTTVDFDTGKLYHFHHREMFKKQTEYSKNTELSYTAITLAHNLAFYLEWMGKIRDSLESGKLQSFAKKYLTQSILDKLCDDLPT